MKRRTSNMEAVEWHQRRNPWRHRPKGLCPHCGKKGLGATRYQAMADGTMNWWKECRYCGHITGDMVTVNDPVTVTSNGRVTGDGKP